MRYWNWLDVIITHVEDLQLKICIRPCEIIYVHGHTRLPAIWGQKQGSTSPFLVIHRPTSEPRVFVLTTRAVLSLKITDRKLQKFSIQSTLDSKMKRIRKPLDSCESVNSPAVVKYALLPRTLCPFDLKPISLLRNSTSYTPSIYPVHRLQCCMFSTLSKSFSPFPYHF